MICIGMSVVMHPQLLQDAKFMILEPISHSAEHSTALLEEVVADDLSRQIDDIYETLQREGWSMPLVKRFIHRAVENLPG